VQKPNYISPDRLIGGCKSWADFWLAAASLSEKQKGDVFERLVQLYLLTKPKYRTELSHVWLRLEVPARVPVESKRCRLVAANNLISPWSKLTIGESV
jgi:hypothetical protein